MSHRHITNRFGIKSSFSNSPSEIPLSYLLCFYRYLWEKCLESFFGFILKSCQFCRSVLFKQWTTLSVRWLAANWFPLISHQQVKKLTAWVATFSFATLSSSCNDVTRASFSVKLLKQTKDKTDVNNWPNFVRGWSLHVADLLTWVCTICLLRQNSNIYVHYLFCSSASSAEPSDCWNRNNMQINFFPSGQLSKQNHAHRQERLLVCSSVSPFLLWGFWVHPEVLWPDWHLH